MATNSIKHLEIILKTVEVCNINCTYCYFFNGIDASYMKHPPYIKQKTIVAIALYLQKTCIDFNIQSVQIDFHGGEPLMQKTKDFIQMCQIFNDTLGSITELQFAIQTNGMLINECWIDIFEKFNIQVGVSLDGPKEYNDIYRVDKRGRGTYDRVVAGINKLNIAYENDRINKPAILSVINPQYPGKKIYRHFVDELNIKYMDFLLPDLTHEAIKQEHHFDPSKYGIFLCNILKEWLDDDDPEVFVRILTSALSLMLGGSSSMLGLGDNSSDLLAFTISSNGELAPDDTLRSASPEIMNTGLTVFNSEFKQFLHHPTIQFLSKISATLPEGCSQCQWQKVCHGGMLINRYDNHQLFNNPSVMCQGLMLFYEKVYQHLVNNGISKEKLAEVIKFV